MIQDMLTAMHKIQKQEQKVVRQAMQANKELQTITSLKTQIRVQADRAQDKLKPAFIT